MLAFFPATNISKPTCFAGMDKQILGSIGGSGPPEKGDKVFAGRLLSEEMTEAREDYDDRLMHAMRSGTGRA